MKLLILLMLVVNCWINTQCCPEVCQCQGYHVVCVGTATIPDNIPANTGSLDLQNNGIETIDNGKLRHLSSLKSLNLQDNKITTIEHGAFRGLHQLKTLDLGLNLIKSLSDGAFQNLSSLTTLHLKNNYLVAINGVLADLPALEFLTLTKNKIQKLDNDTFKDVANLRSLMLDGNNISEIDDGAFRHNSELMMLSMSGNPIGNMDNVLTRGTDQNQHLTYLDLTACNLTHIPTALPATLKYLKLSKNNITRVTKAETRPYTSLTTLVMEENNLSYIEPGAFSHMAALTSIFLFVNKLREIPGQFPQSVKNVYLDSNQIQAIPMESFHQGTTLEILSLRNNQISELRNTSFANLRSIHELHLERNGFKILKDNTFLFVYDLDYLTLSHLKLQEIQQDCFLGLTKLTKLEMSFVTVPLAGIMAGLFSHIPELRHLSLQSSPELVNFLLSHDATLKQLPELTYINLKNNELKTLQPSFAKFLPNLSKIEISGNKFTCGENLLWLRMWMKLEFDKFANPNQVRCHRPRHIQGRAVLDLGVTEFYEPWTGDLSNDTVTESMVVSTIPVSPTYKTDEYDLYDYDIQSTYDQMNESAYDISPYGSQDNVSDYDDYGTKGSLNKTTRHAVTNSSQMDQFNTSTVSQGSQLQTTKTDFGTSGVTTSLPVQMEHSTSLKSIAIGTVAAVSVIILMVVITAIVICLLRLQRLSRQRDKSQKSNYVFIISKTDADTAEGPPRLTRQERGSTTSRASEDITNTADLDMKVYTLEDISSE